MNLPAFINRDIFKNIIVGSLTLICLAALALFTAYHLVTLSYSFIKAGGYTTWVNTPAILVHAESPTEAAPYDALYSVDDKDYRAANYERSLISFDYKLERKRSMMRRNDRYRTERKRYFEGANVNLLVDQNEPKNYQFDLYKDVVLQFIIYGILFVFSAFYSWKLALALFGKDEEEDYEYVD